MITPHRSDAPRRRRAAFALPIALVALAAALVGLPTAVADGDHASPLPIEQEQVELGAAGYAQHCALCHGAKLEGMEHFPPLAGAIFQRRWAERTLGQLYTYVHDLMPLGAGATLPEETYAAIVAFMLERNGVEPGETPFDHEDEAHMALPLVLAP